MGFAGGCGYCVWSGYGVGLGVGDRRFGMWAGGRFPCDRACRWMGFGAGVIVGVIMGSLRWTLGCGSEDASGCFGAVEGQKVVGLPPNGVECCRFWRQAG